MHNTVTCVFVHGWAMNSAVWEECIKKLPGWINVVVVDLPGHGSMSKVEPVVLEDYVQALIPLVHRPVLWVGWSLGGLAVLRLAELFPQRVAAAILVATNPCFTTKADWSSAVDASVFDQFARDLNENQEKTIRRFLALQVKGLPDGLKVVRQLQKSLQSRGHASIQALNSGLDMLLDVDLRPSLKTIECPLHWYLGAKDSLVPASLAQILSAQYAQENIVLQPDAAHAPFVSHEPDFVEYLIDTAEQLRKQQEINK